jgi:hypothetical protein
MSAPEETQDQPGTNRRVNEPMDVAAAVGQLRVLVCGLGAGLLIVSLALSAFVYKQNRNLTGAINIRQRQLSQLQATDSSLRYLLDELSKYSAGKPELMALFAKHGIQIQRAAGATPSLPTPQR